MQCHHILRYLCIFFLALLVSSGARAAPFCFAGSQIEKSGRLTLGDNPTVLVSDDQEGRSVRLLHLRMPVKDAEKQRAQQAVSASLNREGITLWNSTAALDRYRRVLGHLVAEQIWLQKTWIANGIFRVLPGMVPPEGFAGADLADGELACLSELFQSEAKAIEGRRGLWSDTENRILGADELEVLEKHVAQFVLVEGQVEAIGKGGGRHFINFGDDWRSDFTVVVPQSVLAGWPIEARHPHFLQGRALSFLVGQKVRVRGWLTSYRGPEVIVDDLTQIEILGPAVRPSSLK